MEETTDLACINTPFLLSMSTMLVGAISLYWLIHALEKKQSKIEDGLLARTLARKLYDTLKEEKSL